MENKKEENQAELYREYKIEVTREECLAGYDLLYWAIFRAEDNFEAASGCEYSEETLESMVQILRDRIDNELDEDDPWEERTMMQERL